MIEFIDIPESRYERHNLISWWNQKKVANAHIIVVGAGALGNEVLKLLALIGIGRITVIDFDVISRSNLARMVLFRESDVGLPKVDVATARLNEINPEVKIRGVNGDIRFSLGLGEYRDANLVIGCLDSVNARWALNRKCLQAGVEWIDGGISDYHGLVARYNPHKGACYECTFTPLTYERFNERYSCPFNLVNDLTEDKVPTTAVTTSVIAAIQVQQAVNCLHEINDGLLPGEKLTVYLKPFYMLKDSLPENPDCLAHNPLPTEISTLEIYDNISFNQILHEIKNILKAKKSIKFPYPYIHKFICQQCKKSEILLKPQESVKQHQAICPTCGELRTPEIIKEISENSDLSQLSYNQFAFPNMEIFELNGSESKSYIQIKKVD